MVPDQSEHIDETGPVALDLRPHKRHVEVDKARADSCPTYDHLVTILDLDHQVVLHLSHHSHKILKLVDRVLQVIGAS